MSQTMTATELQRIVARLSWMMAVECISPPSMTEQLSSARLG